ncbi:hypothetical protein GSI_15360 [Ganoderma sinense ZZ0214-1]|uniref:Uncharacterized protein n=1 Tax=Ganoderma sinense ZZ0214-1 TaxID=1077348 RepID=A0A2G8RMC2_9APHY|nr:hypothetical protein GSI_15360 [Ganoderma sinense ZZ0214-1]
MALHTDGSLTRSPFGGAHGICLEHFPATQVVPACTLAWLRDHRGLHNLSQPVVSWTSVPPLRCRLDIEVEVEAPGPRAPPPVLAHGAWTLQVLRAPKHLVVRSRYTSRPSGPTLQLYCCRRTAGHDAIVNLNACSRS